jgi:hypothetical protein
MLGRRRRSRSSGCRWNARRPCANCLELDEGIVDRVEVGRIERQGRQGDAGAFDSAPDSGWLVCGQNVHDDDVARPQCRYRHLLGVSAKGVAVHRPVEDHRHGQAGEPQGAGQGAGFPMPMGKREPGSAGRVWRGRAGAPSWSRHRSHRCRPDAAGRGWAGRRTRPAAARRDRVAIGKRRAEMREES